MTGQRRVYIHAYLDTPTRELDPDEMIVLERGDGSKVRIYIDNDGEIRASTDRGRLSVVPQTSNVVLLVPHDVKVEVAARRVRKAIGKDEAPSTDDVRTLVEAALR